MNGMDENDLDSLGKELALMMSNDKVYPRLKKSFLEPVINNIDRYFGYSFTDDFHELKARNLQKMLLVPAFIR